MQLLAIILYTYNDTVMNTRLQLDNPISRELNTPNNNNNNNNNK